MNRCLEKGTDILFKWFSDNLMKSNVAIVSTNNTVDIKVENIDIIYVTCEKLLGIKFDHKLNFNDHISEFCKKASRKIHASARVTLYMNLLKKCILMKVFFNSQFSYCPLYGCVIVVLTIAK